ncbi:MAG TPA: ribbon-helix-helix domain-containing protein [Xanthobacteraceae bacterium]|nr:ribbon-helix-helix domain-containing protein [Xanthobacteraceae bacterium]
MDKPSKSFSHPQYSAIRKRSIVIDGQRTSISLEDQFWNRLRAIAYAQHVNTSALVAAITEKRGDIGLSSAVRQFVLFHSLDRNGAADAAATAEHPADE